MPRRNAATGRARRRGRGLSVCPSFGYVTSSASGSRRTASRRRPIRANGSEFARQQQDQAANPRPVLDPGGCALRRAGRVEREAEQHEGRVAGVGLGGGEARDPAPDDWPPTTTSASSGTLPWNASASSALRRAGRSPSHRTRARPETADERRHRCRCSARTVAEEDSQAHRASSGSGGTASGRDTLAVTGWSQSSRRQTRSRGPKP